MKDKKTISFAPMEGITTRVLRTIHHELYPEGVDRYFTPFIYVHAGRAFKKRDLRDLTDPVNEPMKQMLVPQIMAGHADEIIWACRELSARGFREINLNMGCPSGTVVKKGHGAALLADPEALARMLDAIFSDAVFRETGVRLSVKTRLGMEDPEEFKRILPVFNLSGVSEIILHPRVQRELYAGVPRREYVAWALEHTDKPVCYNGDLFTEEDALAFLSEYPGVSGIMLGRGLLADPALCAGIAGRLAGQAGTDALQTSQTLGPDDDQAALSADARGDTLSSHTPDDPVFWTYLERLEKAYAEFLDERQLLFKLKDLWNFMGLRFARNDHAGSDAAGSSHAGTAAAENDRIAACIHKIRIARDLSDYRNALRKLRALV